MGKTSVFIDGGRFYDAIHARACSVDIDYAELMRTVAGEVELANLNFYLNPILAEVYPARTRHHQAVLDMVAGQGFTVKTGRTEVVYSAYIDRGIEGWLAADIVREAAVADVDTILVVSQRPELVPAVQAARELGKRVEVAFFTNKFDPTPTELSDAADEFKEITVHDILRAPWIGPAPHRVRAALRPSA
ncbi:NYN domain-containing protein [Mycobacterium sp. SMC-4]|uniref:NYN domain-containing protein n=1 Tax=Mycobacterium sp. SMC-4 TaxID=2857059 RepID=UPI003D038B24